SFAAFNAIHKTRRIDREIFPFPLGNVFGGGAHGGYTTFQEFLSLPIKAKTIYEAVETNAELHHRLKEKFRKKAKVIGINDEGAITANVDDLKALDIITDTAEDLGCRIGLDVAASEFFSKGKYRYRSLKKTLKPKDQLDFLIETAKKYRLMYLEDPFEENDFKNTARLTKKIGKDCLICGDDLFVTDERRLSEGIREGAANSIIIKPNQAGTVSQAYDTVSLAKGNSIIPIISHRSGETSDSTLARLAVLWNTPIIKAGVIDMRVAKLNELIHLWNMAESPKMAAINRIK
ncbi:MAG: phosphopyruvate hydratase, partial [archaeon]|nr:phosphopyruvate hydratase [archaeon]